MVKYLNERILFNSMRITKKLISFFFYFISILKQTVLYNSMARSSISRFQFQENSRFLIIMLRWKSLSQPFGKFSTSPPSRVEIISVLYISYPDLITRNKLTLKVRQQKFLRHWTIMCMSLGNLQGSWKNALND